MAEQGDVCAACRNVQWLMTLGGASDAEAQRELCVAHLKAKLAQAMKVVEAADAVEQFLPRSQTAPLAMKRIAYNFERAKLKELP